MYQASQSALDEAAAQLSISLRTSPNNPPIYDQGAIGSCTANATARLIQYARRKAGQVPDWTPSRLLLYFDVRRLEGMVPYDSGAELRDIVTTAINQGVCDEALWPYDIDPADPTTNLFPPGSHEVMKPWPKVYQDARKHLALQPFRVTQNEGQLKACIAAGFPFMFGFAVYSSIYDSDGNPVVNLPLPTSNDEFEGGHAIACVGYDDTRPMPGGETGAFEIANSWGPNVMDEGYFWMPYAYVLNHSLSSDFWTLRKVSA
jgi:C1A family cysteine protease